MIPDGSIAKMFCKIGGDEKLFSLAKDNLLNHLNDIGTSRAHTYLQCNGVSYAGNTTSGASRLYTFANTKIDGKYLSSSSDVETIAQEIEASPDFQDFKAFVENASTPSLDSSAEITEEARIENAKAILKDFKELVQKSGVPVARDPQDGQANDVEPLLTVVPYVSELDVGYIPGKKENDPNIEVVAPVSVGIHVTAKDADSFKQGLQNMENWTLENNQSDYSDLVIKDDAKIPFSFLTHKSTDTLEF
ncbi:MAG: hypothetical protein ACRBCK_02055 [Alphaproteobacteria bacterium]